MLSCITTCCILRDGLRYSFVYTLALKACGIAIQHCIICLWCFGCSVSYSNVKPILDALCSGRQSCSIVMHTFWDLTEDWTLTSSCPRELAHYLQARYTCTPGEQFVVAWFRTEINIIWCSIFKIKWLIHSKVWDNVYILSTYLINCLMW